jgi:TolB-like protein
LIFLSTGLLTAWMELTGLSVMIWVSISMRHRYGVERRMELAIENFYNCGGFIVKRGIFFLLAGILYTASMVQAQTAGPNESVVIISKSPDTLAGQTLGVFIDGQKRLTLSTNNQKYRIVVPNGNHNIHVAQGLVKTPAQQFSANSVEIEFRVITQGLIMKLQKTNETAVSSQGGQSGGDRSTRTTSAAATGNGDIEAALERAADELMAGIEDGSTIAVLSISSRNRETSEFLLEELAYILVDTGSFKVVDRRSLDTIRKEQDFQLTGDVDDSSAVSIGKMLGANIVITGSVSGSESTRRLRLKALDVKTAEIIAMASERF